MWRKMGTKMGVLVCMGDDCKDQSKPYLIKSPAAPELSLCEQAEADGWGYDLGFFAMLRGHTTLCPKCASTSSREV